METQNKEKRLKTTNTPLAVTGIQTHDLSLSSLFAVTATAHFDDELETVGNILTCFHLLLLLQLLLLFVGQNLLGLICKDRLTKHYDTKIPKCSSS